jgi:hypothetical protein
MHGNLRHRRSARTFPWRAAEAAAALLAAACSSQTTELRNVRLEGSAHAGKLHKIAVVGLTANLDWRQTFEDDMAARLMKRGIAAVPSYRVLAGGKLPESKEELRAALEKVGADSVFVARVIGRDTREQVVGMDYGGVGYAGPFGPPGLYGFYGAAYPVYATPVVEPRTVVSVDVKLFDVAGEGHLLWSAQSQTTDPQDVKSLIADVNEQVTKELAKDGYI